MSTNPTTALLSTESLQAAVNSLGHINGGFLPVELLRGASPTNAPHRFGLSLLSVVAAAHNSLMGARLLPLRGAESGYAAGTRFLLDALESPSFTRFEAQHGTEAGTFRAVVETSPLIAVLNDAIGDIDHRRRSIPGIDPSDPPDLGHPLPRAEFQFAALNRALRAKFPILGTTSILHTVLGLDPGRSDYVRARGAGFLAAIDNDGSGGRLEPQMLLMLGLLVHRRMSFEVLDGLHATRLAFESLSRKGGTLTNDVASHLGMMHELGDFAKVPHLPLLRLHLMTESFGDQLRAFGSSLGYTPQQVDILSDLFGCAMHRFNQHIDVREMSLRAFSRAVMHNALRSCPVQNLKEVAAKYVLAAPALMGDLGAHFLGEPYFAEATTAVGPVNLLIARKLGLFDFPTEKLLGGRPSRSHDAGVLRLQKAVPLPLVDASEAWRSVLTAACCIAVVEKPAPALKLEPAATVDPEVGTPPPGGHIYWRVRAGALEDAQIYRYPGMTAWPRAAGFNCEAFQMEGEPQWRTRKMTATLLNAGEASGRIVRLEDEAAQSAAETCVRREVLDTLISAVILFQGDEAGEILSRMKRKPRGTDLALIESDSGLRDAAVTVLEAIYARPEEHIRRSCDKFFTACETEWPRLHAAWKAKKEVRQAA